MEGFAAIVLSARILIARSVKGHRIVKEVKMEGSLKKQDKRTQSLKMISARKNQPIVSIVGKSNSGKTTLLEKLISELKHRGFRVGTIKHDVHGFEMDRPGKDSWRHKKAGASTTIISSPYQIGMVKDVDHDHTPDELVQLLADVDIILMEGYKRGNNPKLEVFRSEVHKSPFCKGDPNLLALISNDPIDLGVPKFSPDGIEALADYLIRHFRLVQTVSTLRTNFG